jgi:hypothetical protein
LSSKLASTPSFHGESKNTPHGNPPIHSKLIPL